jgi:3-phenylpropionate/trans-cinnamate dioxygenase ferredoxin subunit
MAEIFVTVAQTGQIPVGALTAVEVAGVRIAIANVDGAYHAFGDTCTHEQCSLAEGDLAGTTVTCACHGAEFDVRTGAVLAPPARIPVKVYRTRVRGDALEVAV